MKKILQTMVLTLAMLTANAQQTYVPDDAFEDFLEANGMGNGISNDDYVTTASIDTVTVLNILYFLFPTNLIGIEDFTLLEELNCSDLQLSSLDVSQNNNLIKLDCSDNLLVTLNVIQNSALSELSCWGNQLTSLDVSNNIALTYLMCQDNQITSLDVSNSTALVELNCNDNQLTSLDVKNGNNTNFIFFKCDGNPNLTCINVDDANWSTTNWIQEWFVFDQQHYFSNNCPPSAIEEYNANRRLSKIVNIIGEEVAVLKENQIYFYIYDDGSVKKQLNIK